MNSEEISEDLRVLTDKMMKAKQIDDYDLIIEGGIGKGENYNGEIIFFKVSCKNSEEEYNLVFKTCKRSNELIQDSKNDGRLYRNEIYMYADVFPQLMSFSREINCRFKLDNLPTVYSFSRESKRESILMKNLKSSGYKLWDKAQPMNLEHIQLVLKNYGKFHAVSMAVRDQKKEKFQELITGDLFKHIPVNIDDLCQTYKNGIESGIKALRKFGRDDLVDKFQEISDRMKDILEDYTPDDDRLAILHGDCWNNNFMFKYKDDKPSEPAKMCFLDFQLSHLDSPVKDLSFYLYTACDESTLKHFDSFLETYYSSLSFTLKSLCSKPKDLFTMEHLKEHWRKYSIFGLVVSTLFLRIELSTEKEALDFEDLEDGEKGKDPFCFELENNDIYEKRLLDVFTHYAATCF